MIVGRSKVSGLMRNLIENGNYAHPVCLFDFTASKEGMINGLPVLNDINKLGEYIMKYDVHDILLSDNTLSIKKRNRFRIIAKELNIGIHDFSEYMKSFIHGLTVESVLPYVKGKMCLTVDDQRKSYGNAVEALEDIRRNNQSNGIVGAIIAEKDSLYIELHTQC